MITYRFTPEKLSEKILVWRASGNDLSSYFQAIVDGSEGGYSVPLELYISSSHPGSNDLEALQDRITQAVDKMVAELNCEGN